MSVCQEEVGTFIVAGQDVHGELLELCRTRRGHMQTTCNLKALVLVDVLLFT